MCCGAGHTCHRNIVRTEAEVGVNLSPILAEEGRLAACTTHDKAERANKT